MEHSAASDEISTHAAVVRSVAAPIQPRLIRTDIPETLPVLPGESDLILQLIVDALADIFQS